MAFNPAPSFKNALLNGNGVPDINRLSLHNGSPGDTGDNEISGNGYVQQIPKWADAAGNTITLASPIYVPVGPVTVRFIGGWHNGTFRGYWTPDDELTFEAAGYYLIAAGSLSI